MHGNLDDEFTRAMSATAPTGSAATIRSPDCKIVQDPLWFGLLCRHVWPSKPWLMLQQIAGCKERTAYNYASGSCPPADVLRDILRSEHGFIALGWLMQDDPSPWFVELRRHAEIGRKVEMMVRE